MTPWVLTLYLYLISVHELKLGILALPTELEFLLLLSPLSKC